MKFKIGMKMLIAPLTLGLIVGVTAAAQQQTQQGQQQQQKKQDAATSPDRPTSQTDSTRGTDKDRDVGAYSKQGMYDQYRRHWDTRYKDPAFVTYRDQQMKAFRDDQAKQQQTKQQELRKQDQQQTSDRAGQPRQITTYDQFSQDPKLWGNSQAGSNAWHRSDAYWRFSDRYWRDQARRQDPGYDSYWKNSSAYWNDSDRYWDMHFDSDDSSDTIDKDRKTEPDHERTNN